MTGARKLLGIPLTLGAAALAFLGARRYVFAVEVAGTSMSPAFEPGDFLLVRRTRVPTSEAASGLVVYTRDPEARPLLKRIVGVPGDSLRIGSTVQVAGRRLDEPYAHGATPHEQFRGVHELASDEYMVLGDNRAASTDSRDFGPVRRDQIEGVAWLRYWPPERAGLIRRPQRTYLLEEQTPAAAWVAPEPPHEHTHDHAHDHSHDGHNHEAQSRASHLHDAPLRIAPRPPAPSQPESPE